jgi:hypothetical protein
MAVLVEGELRKAKLQKAALIYLTKVSTLLFKPKLTIIKST